MFLLGINRGFAKSSACFQFLKMAEMCQIQLHAKVIYATVDQFLMRFVVILPEKR